MDLELCVHNLCIHQCVVDCISNMPSSWDNQEYFAQNLVCSALVSADPNISFLLNMPLTFLCLFSISFPITNLHSILTIHSIFGDNFCFGFFFVFTSKTTSFKSQTSRRRSKRSREKMTKSEDQNVDLWISIGTRGCTALSHHLWRSLWRLEHQPIAIFAFGRWRWSATGCRVATWWSHLYVQVTKTKSCRVFSVVRVEQERQRPRNPRWFTAKRISKIQLRSSESS